MSNLQMIRARNGLVDKWQIMQQDERKGWEAKSRDDQRRFRKEMGDYKRKTGGHIS